VWRRWDSDSAAEEEKSAEKVKEGEEISGRILQAGQYFSVSF